jgi:hypothetical protein
MTHTKHINNGLIPTCLVSTGSLGIYRVADGIRQPVVDGCEAGAVWVADPRHKRASIQGSHSGYRHFQIWYRPA